MINVDDLRDARELARVLNTILGGLVVAVECEFLTRKLTPSPELQALLASARESGRDAKSMLDVLNAQDREQLEVALNAMRARIAQAKEAA